MQSRVALADAPFPCRWVDRPAPSSSREIQREARRPNARGRLSLNRTPMKRVTRALVPPLGFRIICRRPHHQLLNVKQNPPFHQKPTGGSPLLEKAKKKEKTLTSKPCVRFLSQREKPAVLWIVAFWLCQVRVFVLKNTLACLAV